MQALLALLALGVALAVRRRFPMPRGLTRGQRAGVAIGALGGAAFGAKLPFLFDDWEATRSGAVWLMDGRTLTWGLVGGYFGVELAKFLADVRTKTGDAFAPSVAVAIAIGRIGCFVGGCCYGAPSDVPWAIELGDGVNRHPTQLYEAAFHFVAFGALLLAHRRGWLPGQKMKAYLLAYFAFRFVTEWLRPEPRIWLGWTFYQVSSAVFFAIFAALWAIEARPAPPDEDP